MIKYYKNLFKSEYGNILYLCDINGKRRCIDATHDYKIFKDDKTHLTYDELDIFIFEFELKTGFKPHTELYKGIQADDL